MRGPHATFMAALVAATVSTAARAHEVRCEESVNQLRAYEIEGFPATLRFGAQVFNTHPTEPSVVLDATEPFLQSFGQRPLPSTPVSIPVGESIGLGFLPVTIPDEATCLRLAAEDGRPDDVIETTLAVTTESGAAQCSARIYCRTPQGSDSPNPAGVTRPTGFFKSSERPLQACLGLPVPSCEASSALEVQASTPPFQCVRTSVEYPRVFRFEVTNTGSSPLHDVQLFNAGPTCVFGDRIRFKFDPSYGTEPPPNLPCTFDLAPGESLAASTAILGGPPTGDEILCNGASAAALDECGNRLTGEAVGLHHAFGASEDLDECRAATPNPVCSETPEPVAPAPTTPPVAGLGTPGPIDLGFVTVSTLEQALGLLWASPDRDARGHRRARVDQARVLLAREALAGVCNERLFGTAAPDDMLGQAADALNGRDTARMLALKAQLQAYNDSGVNRSFPPGFAPGVATPRHAYQIARDPTPLSNAPMCIER